MSAQIQNGHPFPESDIYDRIGRHVSISENGNISSTSSNVEQALTTPSSSTSSNREYTRCMWRNECEYSRVRKKINKHKSNVNTKEVIIDTQYTEIELMRTSWLHRRDSWIHIRNILKFLNWSCYKLKRKLTEDKDDKLPPHNLTDVKTAELLKR